MNEPKKYEVTITEIGSTTPRMVLLTDEYHIRRFNTVNDITLVRIDCVDMQPEERTSRPSLLSVEEVWEKPKGKEASCWHCQDVLLLAEEEPPRCDACPPYGNCAVEGCQEPGCAQKKEGIG